MIHANQGHQGAKKTGFFCAESFYWYLMYHDFAKYVNSCPQLNIAKGHYIGPHKQ